MIQIILLVFGLIDILVGVSILYPGILSSISFYMAVIVLLKGIFSFGSAALKNYWLDWMGAVDIIAGIVLLTGFSISYFWVLPIFKGLYTILRHYAGQSFLH